MTGRKVIFGALVLLLLLNLSLQLKNYDKSQWIHQNRASKSDVISTTVAFTLRNVDDLQKTFEEVSSPRNPNWRKYLTKEEIEQRYFPTSETIQTVSNFLTSKGAISVDLSMKGSISAQFTVGDIEKLLKVELHVYESIDGKQKIVRSPTMYTLPAELKGLVDVFSLISEFPALHLRSHTSVNRKEEQSMKKNFNGVKQQLQTRESCNVSPNYGYPETSDTDLYSQVQIVCCNGELTTNVQNPCNEYPPALTGLYVEVKDNFTDVLITTDVLLISQLQCFFDGVGVTCNVPFTLTSTVETYQQYNLYVSELFEENQSSNLAMFPTALVTSAFVTPQLFAQYYNIPLNYRGTAPNNIQSVVEFSGQYYSPSDLAYFFGNMSLVGAPVTLIGPNDAQNPGDEATLDIEWMMGVAVGIPTTFWSVGEGYLIEWTQQLLNSNNPPLVNSVSYAGNEDESPREYRDKVDQQFQLLAARGVTFIVGSGDAGVSDIGHGSQACTPFEPQYPASSPYVTTVSATYFTPSSEAICSVQYYSKKVHCSDLQMGEVAVGADNGMDWTTGGGFSNHSPQPSYQANAVNSYLTNYQSLLPPSNYFNQSNRAYPDVSSNGHNLVLILNGVMDIGDGTSAATPIFSGILALLNDWLLNNGEAPLGFVNPLLYDIAANYPSAFYDVTYGNNKCGDVLHPPYVACCPYGYETSNGWDPVTGLGTPRFNALLSALQNYVASNK